MEAMGSLAGENKYCIIGAGASGLAVAKNFKEQGIAFDCIERESEIGGLWNEATDTGRVYKSTHMVSSKEFTAFDDYPMSDDLPLYPSQQQAMAYLRDFAAHFGLVDSIELNKTVESLERTDSGWKVQISGESEPRQYAGVVIANGHHDKPRLPDIPGRFTGEFMHSVDYRNPSQLAGKRVLVIGAGNSGGDIAVDAVHHAESTFHSMRRGYYFVPRFLFGIPTDDVIDFIEKFRPPRWLRQRMYGLGHLIAVGPNWRYGMPTPEHRILDTHPTVNSELPVMAAEGRVTIKPDVTGFSGANVTFADGSTEKVDMVVAATGFMPQFPFIDRDHLVDASGRPKMHLNVFHPEWDNLFMVGLINANGSMWRIADYQSRLISGFVRTCEQAPERVQAIRDRLAAADRRERAKRFLSSERHRMEVDYHEYSRLLKRLVRKLGALPVARATGSEQQRDPGRDDGDIGAQNKRMRAA